MDSCVFCKIARGEVPKEFTYEDEDMMVFPDIHPLKPIHLLIMPKKHIKELIDISDSSIFEKVMRVVQKMIREQKLDGRGYRLIVNGGGAQLIDHFHVHIVGPMGQKVGW